MLPVSAKRLLHWDFQALGNANEDIVCEQMFFDGIQALVGFHDADLFFDQFHRQRHLFGEMLLDCGVPGDLLQFRGSDFSTRACSIFIGAICAEFRTFS